MTFVEVRRQGYILTALNARFVMAFVMERTEGGYALWAELPDGRQFLVARSSHEDGIWEAYFRLVDAVRASGGAWLPDLSD